MRGTLLLALVVGGCNFRIAPLDELDGGGALAAADLAGGAFIQLAALPAPATVELTAEGTADWAHWGYSSASDFDHKATGNGQISNFQQVGLNVPTQYGDNVVTYEWSDGLPGNGRHPMAAGTTTGIFVLTGGLSISAPADTNTRRLRVYVGELDATGQLVVSLSDNSAPVASDHSYSSSGSPINVEYEITYRAASPGQIVKVGWTIAASRFGGNITLQSATLQSPVF